MKVLVGIPCLLTGGTEIQTLSLVEALVEAGYKVTVACYYEHSEVMVSRYREAGAEVRLLSPDGTRKPGIKNTLSHLFNGLRKVVKETRPDVAHIQYMAPGAIPIIILKLLGVKRIIATAHTSGDIYSHKGLKLVRWVVRHINAFQCITLKAENSFFGNARMFDEVEWLKKHGNHFTIHNTLPSYIKLSGKERDFGGVVTIGVVSRLEKIKGMDLVVLAFARYVATDPNARLLVVGDGSLRKEMESQVEQFGVSGRVEFVGRQPQHKLQDYYDRIDILLMPSRSEGFGLTAIEGMARGCVPVVSATGGLPEVVEDGKSGRLHAPEDVDSIAAAIKEVTTDRKELAVLSTGAIRRAADFTEDRYAARIRKLYTLI